MTEEQSDLDLDAALRLFAELGDHITDRVHREHEIDDSLYPFVLFRLFGYSFNTFKAIGLLLPHRFYEQAWVLYRMLWETSIGLERTSRDPEPRLHQYAGLRCRIQRRARSGLTSLIAGLLLRPASLLCC